MRLVRRLVAALSADRLAAVLLFALFALYGIVGGNIPAALEADVVGPGFFPRIIAVVGAGLALTMFFHPRRSEGEDQRERAFDLDLTVLAPAVLLLAYVLSLETIGFPVATVLFLAVTFRYLGRRGWGRAVLYSVVATAALVALFRFGLELRLPPGELIRLL